MDAIGKNIATNLSTTQILSFYQTLKSMLMQSLKGNDFINIQKAYLEVYSLPVMVGGLRLSALGYHENSLKKIQEAMNVNLGLKEEEMIKTFSYDYNEEYASPIIGKGITGGNKETTVPNLIGSTVKYAEDWANNNGIALEKSFRCSDGIPGIIGDQSVSIGTYIKSISSITIYINQVCDTSKPKEPDNSGNTTDNNTNNDSNSIESIPGGPNDTNSPSDKNDEQDNPPKNDKDESDINIPGGPTNDLEN